MRWEYDTAAQMLVDQETGLVLSLEEGIDRLAGLGAPLQEALAEVQAIRTEAETMEKALLDAIPEGEAIASPTSGVVAEHERTRTSRTVNAEACREHAEVLVDLQLAEWGEQPLKVQGVRALEAATADLARAGIRAKDLLNPPGDGKPKLVLRRPST